MASVYERITSALSALGKRRERDSSAHDNNEATGSHGAKRFRPWEQSDLHRRLETYKPLTWFAKPESVGAVPCALRGWKNDGCDSLCCEYCDAKLIYPSQVPYDQRQAAADLFSPGLISKHSANCPWRKTQCEPSLLAYVPSSNNDELCQLYQSLQNKLLKVDVLPDLDMIAIQTIRDAAAPYGPYDELVLGLNGTGAIVVPGTTPVRHKPPVVQITDMDEDKEGAGPSSSAAAASAATEGTAAAGVADPAAASTTIVVQPSKLTPQQKARLLALLGWDLEVLQPESASGSAAAPYTQSAGYSLAHLGVKPKKPSSGSSPVAAGAGAGAASTANGSGSGSCTRYPMSSVVLKCQHCNGRMGLWNFAGVRPVPSGRLTPAGAAPLLSPKAAPAATAAITPNFASAAAATAADPLSVTIAGGQYGLHGIGTARPFGSAAASAPFRFGAASTPQPVFGVAAMDAEAAQRGQAGSFGGSETATGAAAVAPAATPPPPQGWSFGFGTGAAAATTATTPVPASRRPQEAKPTPPASAAAAATPTATTTTTAGTPLSRLFGSFVGHKRKASVQAVPDAPSAMDVDSTSTTSQQPQPQPGHEAAAAAAAAPGTASKRARLGSYGSAPVAWPPSSPLAGSGAQGQPLLSPGGRQPLLGGGLEGQPRELDPVCQHRSWCPWVYTGTAEGRHKSGWQHMLSALAAQQQQATAAEAAAAAAESEQPQQQQAPLTPQQAGQGQQQAGSAGRDSKQLKDAAIAAIRAL